MRLFDFLKPKPKNLPTATPADMAKVSYGVAYFILPTYAHRDFTRFLTLWRSPSPPFGLLLCQLACNKAKVSATPQQAAAFKTQDGQLSPSCDYYLIQFPTPPPFTGMDLAQLEASFSSGGQAPVLAPFFAAIVDNRTSGQRSYYVLGQSPVGGTTFRSVTADHANCNHGPGPEPTSAAFLQRLKQQQATRPS